MHLLVILDLTLLVDIKDLPMLVDGEVEVQVDLLVVAHKVLDFLQLIILEVVLQVLGLEVLGVLVVMVVMV